MKFSIIIPVYNVEKYLRECIDCVLKQTFNDTEIILIDDGSIDTSLDICREYQNKYSNITLETKPNGGLSSARNAGIRRATGDYVVFLDSDDFWSRKSVLAELAVAAINSPDLICFGYREYVDGKGENGIGIDFSGFDTSVLEKNEVLRELFSKGGYVSSACFKAVRLDVIKQNNLFFREGITSEDIDWSARLLKSIDSIAVFPDSFYCYRQHSKSIVHNISYDNLKMLSENILRCVELGEDIYQGEFRDLYYNYVAYQYITFLKVSFLCEADSRTQVLLKKMKSYSWLLDFHLNRKVRIVYNFKKLFGFNLMYKILKVYAKG